MEYGTLYLCPTPIGNLKDITLRTLEVLKSVDLIAAEDTRNTIKLLNHFEINAPLTSYYEHNKVQKGNTLIKKLMDGQSIALVSDAGMPAISDPGEDLVKLCIENNITVVPLPGASAATTALIASGLSAGRFAFEGFLTVNKRSRKEHLEAVKNDTRTLIFYEAPHKLLSTLSDMLEVFGNRKICVAREITKKFEEFLRTTISGAMDHFNETPPKGEFVLIIEGAQETVAIENQASPEEVFGVLEKELVGSKEIAARAAEILNVPKREAYDMYLKYKTCKGE